jgi:hypothetical protein
MKNLFLTALLLFSFLGIAKADVTTQDFANTKWLGRSGHLVVDFKVDLNLLWTGHSVQGSNKIDRNGKIEVTQAFPGYEGRAVLMLEDDAGNSFLDMLVVEANDDSLPTLQAIEVPDLVLRGKIIR